VPGGPDLPLELVDLPLVLVEEQVALDDGEHLAVDRDPCADGLRAGGTLAVDP
jgi:hypothetical protein